MLKVRLQTPELHERVLLKRTSAEQEGRNLERDGSVVGIWLEGGRSLYRHCYGRRRGSSFSRIMPSLCIRRVVARGTGT